MSDGHFEPWEKDGDCEHDTSRGERCLVAHWVNGVPQPACTRCGKCQRWVAAPLAKAPERPKSSLLLLPVRQCICERLGIARETRCGSCSLGVEA